MSLMMAAGIWAGSSASASAQVTFSVSGTGVGGEALQATATFQTLAGNQLRITLANTETGDAHTTANLLTAIFFDGATGLTPLSAFVPAGQLEWNSGVSTILGSDLDVGTQWGYAYAGGSGDENLGVNPPHNATTGISSSGFGWFGHGNFAAGGAPLDGAAYGLLPLGFHTTGGSYDGLSNGSSDPLFQNITVFTLSNWTGNLDDIANVSFQYGTATTDANVVPMAVPEPATVGFLLLGLGVLVCFRFWLPKRSFSSSNTIDLQLEGCQLRRLEYESGVTGIQTSRPARAAATSFP
jgi:hypothetical protein